MAEKRRSEYMGKAILFALALGVFIHLAFFVVLRIQLPQFQLQPSAVTTISYLGPNDQRDSALLEQTLLYDSAPLFMPTPWNGASQFEGVASLQKATEAFPPFPPETSLNDVNVRGSDLIEVNRPDLLSFLPHGPQYEMTEFGRQQPQAIERGSVSKVQLQILPITGNQAPVILNLPDDLIVSQPQGLWEPMEWGVHLESNKLQGPPQLIRGSSFPGWDELLFSHLRKVDVYSQFPNGYLKVMVNP